MASFITKIRQIRGVRRKVKITKNPDGSERVRMVGYVNNPDHVGKNYQRKRTRRTK